VAHLIRTALEPLLNVRQPIADVAAHLVALGPLPLGPEAVDGGQGQPEVVGQLAGREQAAPCSEFCLKWLLSLHETSILKTATDGNYAATDARIWNTKGDNG
jgi:hypothetical protein